MPSVQQIETSVSQAPVPASQMLLVQQVEAQQAAQQLLQGQQQQPPPAAADRASGSGQLHAAASEQTDSADVGEPSQVRQPHPLQLIQCLLQQAWLRRDVVCC